MSPHHCRLRVAGLETGSLTFHVIQEIGAKRNVVLRGDLLLTESWRRRSPETRSADSTGDAQPADAYVRHLCDAGFRVERGEPHHEALLDMVNPVRTKLLGAEIMVGFKEIGAAWC